MSRPLPAAVPAPLRRLLDADPDDPAVDGFTVLLLTVRDDGWPHQAMLSVGELAVASDDRLQIAVWPSSTSTRNMRDRPRATLTAVVDGVSYALLLALADDGELRSERGGRLARFVGEVVAATADEAPYAQLLGGVRFRLTDREGTIARWRAVKQELNQESNR